MSFQITQGQEAFVFDVDASEMFHIVAHFFSGKIDRHISTHITFQIKAHLAKEKGFGPISFLLEGRGVQTIEREGETVVLWLSVRPISILWP